MLPGRLSTGVYKRRPGRRWREFNWLTAVGVYVTESESHTGEYDIETEPVVGWAIVRDGDEIRPFPIAAPVTDPRSARTPFEDVALAIDDGEEVLAIVADTTGAVAKLAWIEDERGEYLAELGYHYEGATNPDWQAVAATVDEE